MEIKEIRHEGQVLALVFSHKIKSEGVRFLTPNDYTLQLGLLEHPAGRCIKEHIHNPDIKYKVDTTQEFLYIEKGKVKASIYSNNFDLITEIILEPGDFMLHISGGHGFEILEDSRIIEIKQGPYPGPEHVKLYRDTQ